MAPGCGRCSLVSSRMPMLVVTGRVVCLMVYVVMPRYTSVEGRAVGLTAGYAAWARARRSTCPATRRTLRGAASHTATIDSALRPQAIQNASA
jgi:hypothetical protein